MSPRKVRRNKTTVTKLQRAQIGRAQARSAGRGGVQRSVHPIGDRDGGLPALGRPVAETITAPGSTDRAAFYDPLQQRSRLCATQPLRGDAGRRALIKYSVHRQLSHLRRARARRHRAQDQMAALGIDLQRKRDGPLGARFIDLDGPARVQYPPPWK